jgi:GxxExxY protein
MAVDTTAQALNAITRRIIGAAIAVHREMGPGLLESTYRACLAHELPLGGLPLRSEVPIPVVYRNLHLPCGYRADLLVDEQVIVEVKAVEVMTPVHKRQLHTYIQLADCRVGLLLNFGAASMRQGIYRAVYRFPE